jgi:hypothetical protein
MEPAPTSRRSNRSRRWRATALAGALILIAVVATFTLPAVSATHAYALPSCSTARGGLSAPGVNGTVRCGPNSWSFQFDSPWNSIVTVAWTSAPQPTASSNPPSMPCTLPNGQLTDHEGNSASFTFTSSGGSTDCTFYDVVIEPVWVNVTVVSPAA